MKHGKCPITRDPLAFKDLTRIIIVKGKDGMPICPITRRTLDPNSNVICIRTSGRVYSTQMLENFDFGEEDDDDNRDPISNEPVHQADVITIQDPFRLAQKQQLARDRAKKFDAAEMFSHSGLPQAPAAREIFNVENYVE
mmetsp:Transcript_5390/g.10723  ORF Transcript_5390/g.10723 Transcript_5390/m.10723 type:complete len:140 (-) Transcript_5390:353-772(-)